MKKLIIIPLLFLVGCITIKPECPCNIATKKPVATIGYNDLIWNSSDTIGLIFGNGMQRKYLDSNGLIINSIGQTLRYWDEPFQFKDTIKPEPIWDFNVVDSSYDAIDDSIIIYQFRYRVIPVEKEIYL